MKRRDRHHGNDNNRINFTSILRPSFFYRCAACFFFFIQMEKLLLLFTCELNKALLCLDLVFLGFRCLYLFAVNDRAGNCEILFFLLLLFKNLDVVKRKKCRMVMLECVFSVSTNKFPCPIAMYAKIIIYFANKYAELNFHCPVSRS